MKVNKIIYLFIFFSLCFSSVFSTIYNENGDFKVELESLRSTVYNDNINDEFKIKITNNLNYAQNINLNTPQINGWDVDLSSTNLLLSPKEEKIVTVKISTNENFDYGKSVMSPDLLKIVQKSNYEGNTNFLFTILGVNEEVSFNYNLIVEKYNEVEDYKIEIATQEISPKEPLKFSIRGENILEEQTVQVLLKYSDIEYSFDDKFSKDINYKIYERDIENSITPGPLYVEIIVRLKKENGLVWEWESQKDLIVLEYNELKIEEIYDKGFFKNTYVTKVSNLGNVDEEYTKSIDVNLFNYMFFESNLEKERNEGKVEIKVDIQKGETKEIIFWFNYLPIYVVLFVIVVLSIYIYVRKNSNPLDVETKIYEIKKVKHEGLKSLKIRIGFENIKESSIDDLSVIFRMPGYLNVKDNTFLLTEPNHVLKGKDQYKLIWDFKRFEKNDSRILGFALINSRGILGDIKIPDLEFEVKSKGKIRKYTKSFPVIKG